MDEKPKSIWKKSWTGWRGLLLGWLGLMLATLIIFWVVMLASGARITGEELKLWAVLSLCATLIIFLVLFIRWVFCWRNFKRFLFGCACLATLIGLFYAEENWRGKHDWEKYKREWEAKGEHFDFASTVPPAVPDDQNFAMAPIFSATRNLASRKWRNEHRNQHSDTSGNPWDTNLADPLQIDIFRSDLNNEPTNGSWAKGTFTDLASLQAYYRAPTPANRNPPITTNEFPISPQPQTPAQDVLLALSKYDSTIEELRQAGQLPYSRFPLDYDDEDPAEILLPHLAALKRSSQVLQLRALAELENGQTEKSFDDIKLSLRLVDSIRTEPFIITHLVRLAMLQIALQPIYEGLAEHKWSDAQLAALDLELSKLDFLADYEYSTRGERAAHIKIVDWMEQKRSRFWELFNMIDGDERNMINNFGLSAEVYLMPRGWYYQSEIVISDVHQKWIQPMVDDARQAVSPELARQAKAAVSALKPIGINFFARLLVPELGTYAKRVAHGQTAVNETRIAIALERFRLAHGNFPDSLDALVPQFLEKIPHDVIGGQPLKYRRESDGQFVLYSVGWNETDDGGVVVFKNTSNPRDESKPGVDLDKGDWVWRYLAKTE